MVCAAQTHARVGAPITLGDCAFTTQQAAKYAQSSAGWYKWVVLFSVKIASAVETATSKSENENLEIL